MCETIDIEFRREIQQLRFNAILGIRRLSGIIAIVTATVSVGSTTLSNHKKLMCNSYNDAACGHVAVRLWLGIRIGPTDRQ